MRCWPSCFVNGGQETCPRLVHRVYHVTREAALERYGDDAASAAPDGGLTDVHRYLVMTLASISTRHPSSRVIHGA